MFYPILVAASLVLLLSDIYLWRKAMRHMPRPWAYIHWIAPVVLVCVIVYSMLGGSFIWLFTFFSLYVLLVCLPRLLHTVLTLARLPRVGWAVRIGVLAIVMAGTLFGWRHLVVRQVPVACAALPASFQGYRIAHISDLHLSTFALAPGTVEKIVEMVNAQQPDLIVFTGDLVSISADELPRFMPALAKLSATDGVLSVMGNHDYCLYGEKKKERPAQVQAQELIEMQRKMGWQVLLNEHVVVHRDTDSLAILGIENSGRHHFGQRGDLPRAMEGLDDETFKILLSHDPSFWHMAVTKQTNIPLTLSGHTHAMQFRIGSYSPSVHVYREWGGLYTQGHQHLHVSVGTGSNIPFRLGAWPEIDIITLQRP